VWPTQGNEAPLVYRGHRDAVFAVAVSPDGNWIASAGRDREIQLWQPRDLREFDFAKLEQQLELVRAGRPQASDERYHTPARRLLGHEGEVATLAFSRDGKVLLSGGHDNTVRRWLLELKENDPQAVKVLRGHGGWVKGVVSLAGGEWAASVGHDEQLKRWQLDTYQEVETLRGHDDAVLQASFSADGSRLVTASRDRRVLLWDTARGAQLKELIEHTDTPAQGSGPIADLREGHEFLLSSATFFPGEPALLATAAGDNSVRVWDVVAGAQVKLLPGTGTVSVTAISPSGTWLLTGSESTSVLLWNMQHAGKPISLAGHQHEISAATFAHGSDDLLVTGDIRGRVFLWRRDSQRNEWSIAHDLVGHLKGYTITGVRFSPDDSRVYVASRDQTVMQWDTKTGLLLSERTWKHTDAVKSFDLAPHGNQALTLCATAEGNYRAYLWDTASNSSRHCDLPVDGVATGIAFDSQGQQAWIAVNTAETSSVWQWDLQASQAQQLWPNLPLRGTIWSLLPARDPQQVLAIGGNNARLLDLATGRLITPFRPHNAVHAARFSPNGKEIVSTGADGDVKIWNADDTSPAFGRVRIKITRAHDLNDRPQPVNDAAFLPDGEQVVTAGDDHTVKLWRLADTSATLVQTFQGHTQRVLSVSLSSSGEKLVTASADGTARVWSLGPLKNEAARTVAEFVLPHPSPVYAATISPDGRFVATGAADHLARVWDLDHPNKPLWELAGHTAGVTSTSISPDAARLVTGSEDGMLKLWDLATGNQVLGLKRHSAEISSVQFSPDGQNLLSSSADRTSLLFRALSLPRATAP
jgi:WD40 repeat protein